MYSKIRSGLHYLIIYRKNPKQLIRKQSSHDKAEERARAQLLPSFDAVVRPNYSTYPGYTDEIKYGHPPLSRYQKTMREHVYAEKVSSHYTIRFNAGVVERVTCIPMEPGAFHDGAYCESVYYTAYPCSLQIFLKNFARLSQEKARRTEPLKACIDYQKFPGC